MSVAENMKSKSLTFCFLYIPSDDWILVSLLLSVFDYSFSFMPFLEQIGEVNKSPQYDSLTFGAGWHNFIFCLQDH